MQQITIDIRGMSCGGCVRTVRDALGRIPGAHLQTVTLGSAMLAFDPAIIDCDTIFAAIKGAGYLPQPA